MAPERRQRTLNSDEEERVNALMALGGDADEKPAACAVAADAGMGRTTAATILKHNSNPWSSLKLSCGFLLFYIFLSFEVNFTTPEPHPKESGGRVKQETPVRS